MNKPLAMGLFGVEPYVVPPGSNKFIEDYKEQLLSLINDDIEHSIHDELVILGWTPPEKAGE